MLDLLSYGEEKLVIDLHALLVQHRSSGSVRRVLRLAQAFLADTAVAAMASTFRTYQHKRIYRLRCGGTEKGKEPMYKEQRKDSEAAPKPIEQRCTKPDRGMLKVNVDARFMPGENISSWGAIVRDQHGQTILAAWSFHGGCSSPEEAEALACLSDLKFMQTRSVEKFIVETECIGVATIINSGEDNQSEIWSIYRETQEIKHRPMYLCYQGGNQAAHVLES